MESIMRFAVALLLASTVTFSTSSAAPAVKEQNKRATHVITDDQVVRLKQLLARLKAENGNPTQASVEQPSDQKTVNEGQPKEQEQQHQSSPDNATHHPQSRALSAEDMRDRNVDIVEQLRRLDKADTAQVLARALSEVEKRARGSEEKAESQETEKSGSNSAGDDMGTSNNANGAPRYTETENVDITQLIEALIKQGLANVDRDSGHKQQSLFHTEPRHLARKNKGIVEEPLDQQIKRYMDLLKTDEKDEESQEILEEEQVRQKDLQIVESRLMQDINVANMLGVTVEDLIRDLEEREKQSEIAYIEANAKRIEELLDMHEQGRD